MVSFTQQLLSLTRDCALTITRMLAEKHKFDITEIYGDQCKSSTETKQRYLYVTNEWGPEYHAKRNNLEGLAAREAIRNEDNMPWGAKQFAGIYDDEKKPDNMTPEESGMSKGRCPI